MAKTKKLKKLKQVALLEKIAQLSNAGIHQRNIAKQLSIYGHGIEKNVGLSCLNALGQGKAFSLGLEPFISTSAYQSLSSGERVGQFVQGVQEAIDALNVDEASTGALLSVLIKPVLGLTAILGLGAVLSNYAYPSLVKQLPIERWGELSQFAYGFGTFWLNYGGGVFALTLGIIVFVMATLGMSGRYRAMLDNLPFYRQYRLIQSANLLSSIAHQTLVGNPLKQSLLHYQTSSSAYLSAHIQTMLNTLGQGRTNVGDIFNSGLLLDEELSTLTLLGEIGNTSDTLHKSALIHRAKLLTDVNRLKHWGDMGLKISAGLIAFVLFGGLISLIFTVVMSQGAF
ncbi:hypothetical protein GNP84_06635 [Aliivibrio fischeri]|uniref:hypothetical protein n=1 Tax=Aliivibrio fischeri TaxID=668 RepID=UPI0012D9C293|nr:hypothetical protein [Aliivibrio fischeri]MUK76582.1 hypothetical protein [Aliivibrio fischeri]